jgi:hypothetical protein
VATPLREGVGGEVLPHCGPVDLECASDLEDVEPILGVKPTSFGITGEMVISSG